LPIAEGPAVLPKTITNKQTEEKIEKQRGPTLVRAFKPDLEKMKARQLMQQMQQK
jgi:hypothetical protein